MDTTVFFLQKAGESWKVVFDDLYKAIPETKRSPPGGAAATGRAQSGRVLAVKKSFLDMRWSGIS